MRQRALLGGLACLLAATTIAAQLELPFPADLQEPVDRAAPRCVARTGARCREHGPEDFARRAAERIVRTSRDMHRAGRLR